MEYFPLGDLQSFAGHPKSEADVKSIGRQLAKGLEMMHDAGYMHRDLKPHVCHIRKCLLRL